MLFRSGVVTALAHGRWCSRGAADLLRQQAFSVLVAERLLGLLPLPVVLRAVRPRRRLRQLLVQRPHLQVLLLRPVPAPLLFQLRRCDVSIRPSTLPQCSRTNMDAHRLVHLHIMLHGAQDRVTANRQLSTMQGSHSRIGGLLRPARCIAHSWLRLVNASGRDAATPADPRHARLSRWLAAASRNGASQHHASCAVVAGDGSTCPPQGLGLPCPGIVHARGQSQQRRSKSANTSEHGIAARGSNQSCADGD